MTELRTLLLLRHGHAEAVRAGHRDADRRLDARGEAEAVRAGHRDADRRLDARGEAEADGVGDFLREQGLLPDRVLCSPARRTRQTLERLRLDAPVEVVPLLYQAGSEEILELVAAADVATVLVVGHAPGLPGLVYDLAEPGTSAPAAVAAVADRFPPGTLAVLTVQGSWADPSDARLVAVRLPSGRAGRTLG